MIGRNRVDDLLKQNRLTGFRLRDDEATLTEADRRKQVENARTVVRRRRFELEMTIRVERRQLVELWPVFDLRRLAPVDGVYLDEGKESFALLRRTHVSIHRITQPQTETLDLRRRHVNVLGAGQVVVT